jgi:DNA-binding transcriptional LysR family regulator
MGDTIAEFERRIGSQDLQFTGIVRLNTVEAIGCLILPKVLADFRAAYPGLQVELSVSVAPLELFAGMNDLALRVLQGPPPPELSGRKVAGASWAVYASPALIPVGEEERLATAPWVTLSPGVCQQLALQWINRNVEPSRQVATVGSLMVLAHLVEAGVGAALLPCLVGASKPELRQIGEIVSEADGEIWLVAAPQALKKARVRALYDFLATELESRRGWFEGETPPGD